MVLKKYYDLIKPDIILWQFCSNDFINNDLELESSRWGNNNPRMRPFYRNGQIEWLHLIPKDKRWIEDDSWIGSLVRHSYLLQKLFPGSDLSDTHPLAIEAFKTTAEIMKLVKEEFGHKPIVAFLTDKSYSAENAHANISENLGFHFVRGIPESVSDAKKQGIQVDGIHDFHWSAGGHAIAGKNILDYLIKNNLLISQPKTENQ